LFQQEFAEAFGHQPQLCGGGGMRCQKHELAIF